MHETVAPRPTRAEETAARRRRLLDAASALATEGGYEAVQMRDVAARAGVALGTLYRQFSSKDQLLLACLAAQAAALHEQLANDPPDGTTPATRLAAVLRRASRAIERDPRLSAAMVTALSSPDPAAADAKQEVFDLLISMIADAAGDGAGHDLQAVARVVGYVWFSALEFWVAGLIDGDEMADDLAVASRLLLD
jgi:TetR/AcrR family transcriptional regulator, cholesterol catabolism regulator